jgi:hypothetical protein
MSSQESSVSLSPVFSPSLFFLLLFETPSKYCKNFYTVSCMRRNGGQQTSLPCLEICLKADSMSLDLCSRVILDSSLQLVFLSQQLILPVLLLLSSSRPRACPLKMCSSVIISVRVLRPCQIMKNMEKLKKLHRTSANDSPSTLCAPRMSRAATSSRRKEKTCLPRSKPPSSLPAPCSPTPPHTLRWVPKARVPV